MTLDHTMTDSRVHPLTSIHPGTEQVLIVVSDL
jgi:hypothetical protein